MNHFYPFLSSTYISNIVINISPLGSEIDVLI
jgi:hypothetical protein